MQILDSKSVTSHNQNLMVDILQEERFSQEIVTIIINTPLVSVEDADFLANMFDSRLTTEVFELKRLSI